jgi:Mce-associated membrane protein
VKVKSRALPRAGTARNTALGLGFLVIGLVVATVIFGVLVLQGNREEDQRAKAVQAARQLGVNLVTINHTTAQKDLDRIVAGTTGELKNQFGTQGKVIVDTATKAQTQSTLDRIDAAVVSMDGDSAEVMVSVNSVVAAPKTAAQPRKQRFLMDVTKQGDRWLVSKLEMVSS